MAKQKSSNDQLLKLFKDADKDNSGSLSRDELKQLLTKANRNIKESQIDEVFKFFEASGDQKIDFKEFKAGLEKIAAYIRSIEECFKKYDKDGSGHLDKCEMKALLVDCGLKFTDAELNEIFCEADKDKNNTICLKEFLDVIT